MIFDTVMDSFNSGQFKTLMKKMDADRTSYMLDNIYAQLIRMITHDVSHAFARSRMSE